MIKILLVVHLLIALAMVGVVLLQRSEGGILGIMGGGSGFITGRQASNLLTRTTAFLATIFMVTSLALAVFGGSAYNAQHRLTLDQVNGVSGENNTAISSPMPLAVPAPVVPNSATAQTAPSSTSVDNGATPSQSPLGN